MELELKHIKGYLGTGLKAINIQNNKEFELELYFLDYVMRNIEIYKLLLRPFSQLTKEIEHNGKKVVPILEILKELSKFDLKDCVFEFENYTHNEGCYAEAINQTGFSIDCITFDGNIFSMMHRYSNGEIEDKIFNPQLDALNLLYKYHFDIHGLIENNLAIEIK